MTHQDHVEQYRPIDTYRHSTDKVIFEIHPYDNKTAWVTAQELILQMLSKQIHQNDTEANHVQQI